ncbi:L-selectin [Dissostichus eleginoides]|uniref:L-selectin n=1 Tax=Dissostichus eleginoides TaxID=100907 RepID=A0AAD9BWJ5_DISEL|nr:L-selectin [Dissostichus eleginoides]
MQWILFVLILMGQCSFFTCHLYEYHLIKDKKSWIEAQSYCREKYTDLATVSNMRDLERLTEEAWIGLHSKKSVPSGHWSLPGVEFNASERVWLEDQQSITDENCVVIRV